MIAFNSSSSILANEGPHTADFNLGSKWILGRTSYSFTFFDFSPASCNPVVLAALVSGGSISRSANNKASLRNIGLTRNISPIGFLGITFDNRNDGFRNVSWSNKVIVM